EGGRARIVDGSRALAGFVVDAPPRAQPWIADGAGLGVLPSGPREEAVVRPLQDEALLEKVRGRKGDARHGPGVVDSKPRNVIAGWRRRQGRKRPILVDPAADVGIHDDLPLVVW